MAGRPTVMTEKVIAKIEEELKNGATLKQACFLANIGYRTVYNYFDEFPEFKERCELLQQLPNYLARKNIVTKITDGDLNESRYWLDRKDREFKPKQDLTTDDEKIQPVLVKFIEADENNRDTNRIQEAV